MGYVYLTTTQLSVLTSFFYIFRFGTLASAVGPVVGGLVLEFVGRKDANDGQFYSLLGYETLFTLTAVFFLFSAVSLAFVQKKGV